jgi:hypothetical protein
MNFVEALKIWVTSGLLNNAITNSTESTPRHYYVHSEGFMHSCYSSGETGNALALYAEELIEDNWKVIPVCPVCYKPVRPHEVGYPSDMIHIPKCDGRKVRAWFCCEEHKVSFMASKNLSMEQTYHRLIQEGKQSACHPTADLFPTIKDSSQTLGATVSEIRDMFVQFTTQMEQILGKHHKVSDHGYTKEV